MVLQHHSFGQQRVHPFIVEWKPVEGIQKGEGKAKLADLDALPALIFDDYIPDHNPGLLLRFKEVSRDR